jgi:hypothetical protein
MTAMRARVAAVIAFLIGIAPQATSFDMDPSFWDRRSVNVQHGIPIQ